ncbi:MAG: flagellar assembly protein FliW [Myxococcota bacterium]
MSERVRFESRRVGRIEVAAEDVVHFEPIPGFPEKRRFILMEHAPGSALAWLVSLDDPDLAFVVTSPWGFFPNYDPPVEREHLATLGIERRDEVELLCIVSLSGKEIFLNLAAPLVVNAANRKGMQVVSDDPRYTTRAPIPMLQAGSEETSETEAANVAAP